jgi:WD40 repeat protein
MKLLYTLAVLAGSTLSLSGQKTFSGPASGYVFDDVEHSVRPILGVPGAAYLGSQPAAPSQPPQPPWDSVSVAPNGKRALGVSGVSICVIPDLSQPTAFTSIGQSSGPILRIAWSGDSTTAAAWSPAAGQLLRITGLDSTPVVDDPIDLTALSGNLAGWSLSPDGRYVALSSRAAETGSVYISDSGRSPLPIGSLIDPGVVAFSVDGASLFVFSGSKHQILMLSVPSGAIAGSFDASPFDSAGGTVTDTGIRELPVARRLGLSGVEDLAVSADGASLYALGGEKLCGYDVSTGQAPSCSRLEVAPGSFQSMPGGVFLLNYPRTGNMPIWLLDGKTGQTWFVPAGNVTADASF